MAKQKSNKIVRKFEVDEEQGIAALLVATKVEGLPLKSFVRKGEKVTAIYERNDQ